MKKKKFLVLAVCIILICSMLLVLVACGPNKPGSNNNNNTNIFDLKQNDINMTVSVSSNTINIELTTNEGAKTGEVDILQVKAYEYLEGDGYSGMSASKIASSDSTKKIGVYATGAMKNIEIDRFGDGGYDKLYDKFYAVQGDKIIKGPIYATEIEAKNDVTPDLDIKSKKGVLGENVSYYKDLNCSYTTLNLVIDDLIYPNEMYEDGEAIELAPPEDAYTFESNGKTYYFRKSRVNEFDNMIKTFYAEKAHITAILYARNLNISPETFPQNMTYLPYSTQGTSLLSINTSNQSGFEYYIAIMEFLAARYSDPAFENGYIANYVIGNEIDFSYNYFRIAEEAQNIDIYMEEYSRLLRLSNLAVKKYNANAVVNIPVTQAWATNGVDYMEHVYAPKTMIEWLNYKTKLEGDYNWGIAPHCYTYGLAPAEIFLQDTLNGKNVGMTNDVNTTSKITFSNLELLGDFLGQDNMKFNGNLRTVWLTESGVSSLDDKEKDLSVQAGSIAAVWYKISQLDFVTSFMYYRLYDHEVEVAAKARFGVLDINRLPKPSYNVLKYIDTQYSEAVANRYLEHLSYINPEGTQVFYKRGIESYMDLLDVFGTNWFDGNFDWDKATPITIDTIYEYEDKIDLSSIRFDSKNYLYDGTEKRLDITGTLPEGVTVEFDKEPVLTEKGSIEVLATFTKEGEVVGRRLATLTIGDMATNKSVYNYGENIFVTANIKDIAINRNAWIGLYRKGAVPGDVSKGDISYYYFYPNTTGDTYLRTICLQDNKNPGWVTDLPSLPAGTYVLYYFDGINGDYNILQSFEITILPKYQAIDSIDLSNIKFEDKEFNYDGEVKTLEIIGELPEDVVVEYCDNTQDVFGKHQCTAIFKYNGVEIERRYAVMTITDLLEEGEIVTDKEEYIEGEDVIVRVKDAEGAAQKSWWVGLYLQGEEDYNSINSIYWYYVNDENHIPGKPYNLKTDAWFNASRADYKDLPAGKYKLVLFDTSGYTERTRVNFVIKNELGDFNGTIDLDKTIFNLDEEQINATITVSGDASLQFKLALLQQGIPSNIEFASLVIDISDSCVVDILHNESGIVQLNAGKYKLVLFAVKGEKSAVITEQNFQYGSDEEQPTIGTIYTNKNEYKYGESIYVSAYVPDGNTDWWIGVYTADTGEISGATPSIYWYYVLNKGASGAPNRLQSGDLGGGTLDEQKNLPAGEYKIVLFNTTGYTVESTIYITINE